MGPKDFYLILYNAFCCAGWGLVLKLALTTVVQGGDLMDALAKVYSTAGLSDILTYSQSAALMEILHAAFGLVRSPVMVTAMQVGSRIFALVALNSSIEAQSKYEMPTFSFMEKLPKTLLTS